MLVIRIMPMQAVLPLVSAHVFFYQEALQRYASSRSEQKCEKIEKKKKKISHAVYAEKLKIQSQLFFLFYLFSTDPHTFFPQQITNQLTINMLPSQTKAHIWR